MPATPTSIGSATGSTSSATLAMTVTANVAVGDYVVVAAGCFATASSVAISDSGGNTWTSRVAANSNRISLHTCRVTTALTSGSSTITVTWGDAQVARTIAACKITTGLAASAEYDQSASDADGGTTAAWSTGNTGTLAQADNVILAASSCDTAAAATSSPSGAETELADITNGGAFQLVFQYKNVSATTAVSSGGTWTSSGWAWNAALIVLKEAASGTTFTKAGLAIIGP